MPDPKNDQLSMFLGRSMSAIKASSSDSADETMWSPQQKAIFAAARECTDNLAIEARAGTGKTTTAVELIKRTSARGRGRILYAAFNRAIKEDVQPKLAGVRNVDVRTLNGVGYNLLCQYDRDTQTDAEKGFRIAQEIAGPTANTRLVGAIKKAASYLRAQCITNVDEAEDVLFAMEIDAEPFATGNELAQMALRAIHASQQMLGIVDYDDQVTLPVTLGLTSKYPYDNVIIDEAQDMNEAQLRLCLRVAGSDGRIIVIGDPKQAIYVFRGADEGTYNRIANRLDAKRLLLTVTYRCAKAIVREANHFVPDLIAAPGAPEGVVSRISHDQMRKLLKPGDFVLSRTNAALVEQCTAAIRAGIRSNIQGRDLGQSLAALVRKANADDVEELTEWIEAWQVREVEKRQKKDQDPQPAIDRAQCVLAFTFGCRSVAEVLRAITTMFEDVKDADRVVFSTTHRAKGLERERVFVLAQTYLKPRPVRDPETGVVEFIVTEEEKNLYYVAVTRAKTQLYLVG